MWGAVGTSLPIRLFFLPIRYHIVECGTRGFKQWKG